MIKGKISIEYTEITIEPKKSLKGLTGGWSKWGGSQGNIVKEKIHDHWFCQSCGDEQPESLSPYMIQLVPEAGEYFRVCAKCLNNRGAAFNAKVGLVF